MDINFSRNLIKGKITEAIFEEMFRTAGEFTIIPLGYEHTTPLLAQYQHLVHIQKVLDNIRHAPDFALVSEDKSKIFLVEVKYRDTFTNEDILEIANKLNQNWNPCFLFIASKDNFYFQSVQEIINKSGKINVLDKAWIRENINQLYFSLLHEFIK